MNISFSASPKCILVVDPSQGSQLLHPGGQWLPGTYVNPARDCLSLRSKRNLNDVAVIWRNEGSDQIPVKTMTIRKLRSDVRLVAYALDTLGLDKGSAIAIDMPMDVNSVVIYLTIVLVGYVVVSIADCFAPNEISTRSVLSKAKGIFTQDVIIRGNIILPLYRRVVDARSPLPIVIPTRDSCLSTTLCEGDISWHDFLGQPKNSRNVEFVAVERPIEAFSNILFSSGTTGEPKQFHAHLHHLIRQVQMVGAIWMFTKCLLQGVACDQAQGFIESFKTTITMLIFDEHILGCNISNACRTDTFGGAELDVPVAYPPAQQRPELNL